MKSLQESLFDKDLVQKGIPTFGDKYKLTGINVSWGDYYSSYNGFEEDMELVNKMFKVKKLKNIKPAPLDGVDVPYYRNHLEFYEPFLQMITLVDKFLYKEEDTPVFDTQHIFGTDLCKDEWKDLEKYLNMGKTDIRLWKHARTLSWEPKRGVFFSIKKNFGSSEKYLQFKATFEER